MSDYQKLFSLKGRRALVTGGTGGLGSAIAAALLEAGADTAVCGGHPEKAAGLKDLAGSLGRRFLSLRCDITNPQDVSAMMDAVRDGWIFWSTARESTGSYWRRTMTTRPLPRSWT